MHVVGAAPAISLPQAVYWYGGHDFDSCNVFAMFVQPYGYCKDLTEYLDMLKLAEKQPSVLLALVGEVLCSRYRPLSGQAGVSQTP